MGGIENNSSSLRLIESLRDEVKRGKKDCQSEAIDLFKKIFEVIDSHSDTPSVNKGLDDLAVQVGDLEAKLSVVSKERDNLLDTVDTLRAEIMRLSAKLLPTMQPVSDEGVNHSQGILEADSFNDGNLNTKGQEVKRRRIRIRGGDQKEHSDHREPTDQIVHEQTQNSLNDPYDSDDYDFNAVEDAETKDVKHLTTDDNEHDLSPRKDLLHGEHDKIKKDYENDASKKLTLENQNMPVSRKGDTQFKCNQCPYSTDHDRHMRQHVEGVHLKIRNHRCEECGYAALRKSGVERHWDAVHNKGDKKYKCGRCPYSSAENSKLKKHIMRVHETNNTNE